MTEVNQKEENQKEVNQKEILLPAFKIVEGKGEFILFPGFCKGCGLCIEKCPPKTLGWSEELGIYGTPVVEPGHGEKLCTGCGICENFCPECAIKITRLV